MIHPGSLFAKLEVRVARRRLFLRAIRPETHPFAPVSSTPASVLAGPAPASASAAAPRASPRFGDATLGRFAAVIDPPRARDSLAVSFAYRRVRVRAFHLAPVSP